MAKKIKKILIANRGEIAVRIMKTAKKMGIMTVAVYSDADKNAFHTRQADQAIHIGASPAADSYLNIDKIIAAARQSGADAIHPGYGFLSENPDFVEAATKAGLIFIGPSCDAIRAMGLKDAAKKLMHKAGVRVVPGYHGKNQNEKFLAEQAEKITYPVLIKARAGGGGKGMRKVDTSEDFAAALQSAKSEARSSFGDDRVLIEKYIQNPRHIEVQILGDQHGKLVHLYERDCSLQRRHQKIVEEAPAPGMDEPMRRALTEAAIKAAKAINYINAGTVEFIADGSDGLDPDKFWFMEMNTRLQVEHPVTEMITGLDLVKWQILVAEGQKLPLKQNDIGIDGHAIETRLYAEDPANGFLPVTGKLHHLHFADNARIDTGVVEGDEITPYYDPMIAKIITWGKDRNTVIANHRIALVQTQIAGLTTNRAFAEKIMTHRSFQKGAIDTGLIERDLNKLTSTKKLSSQAFGLAALLVLFNGPYKAHYFSQEAFCALDNFALWGRRSHFVDFIVERKIKTVKIANLGEGLFEEDIGGKKVELSSIDNGFIEQDQVLIDGQCIEFDYALFDSRIAVFALNDDRIAHFELQLYDPGRSKDDGLHDSNKIIAPMPGLIKAVFARAGQELKKGKAIAVLEAMKMEHTLTTPYDCVIAEMPIKPGEQIEAGALIATLDKAKA